MKKVLFTATYGDFLATFELSNIKILRELHCEVHCASNFTNAAYNRNLEKLKEAGVILHEVDFSRTPCSGRNIAAYRKLKQIMRDEQIDILDTHNPIVSVFARWAAHRCRLRHVFYTTHGFAFYEGSSFRKKVLYKTMEKVCARYTDHLICINREDYRAASTMPVRGKVLYVPGVGIDTVKIAEVPTLKAQYCAQLQIPSDAGILISVGELIPRKNYRSALLAFHRLGLENTYYLICGIGTLQEELQEEVRQLGLTGKVRFLGYRSYVIQLMKISDIFVHTSFQEGLPVALMEAMACGLPCLVSAIRGNTDLITSDQGGLLCAPTDHAALAASMGVLLKDTKRRAEYGRYNLAKSKKFDIAQVQDTMHKEYKKAIRS
ncbi:MAG: glycosyltransferase family 4 protein [Lachnospiraceae bacterium]